MFLSKAHHKESEIPTSSLADIVFLLLIFFLVTTSIDTGKAINLILPYGEIEKPLPPDMVLNVLINDNNALAVEGEPMTIAELRQEIKNELVREPRLIVSLKTGNKTNYQTYVSMLDNIKEAYGDKTPRISIVPPTEN